LSPLSNLQPTLFTVSIQGGTFDSRTRHHLSHFLNGNLAEVVEMHHSENTTAAAHCWWQHALLTFSMKNSAISLSALMSVEADAGIVT